MAITITESWIRERVQLKTDNLEDVRSLTLPGTYQEKIELIGTALRNFGRLKHLDVSRNALVSLDGLEHHKLLEKLNLYYNNIETLDELYKLRHNHSLTELDLRLNPVTRNEPDYRLFLIHMLPSLKILDDRSVRDGERKAALVHYSTDQASEFKVQFAADDPDHVKQGNPRVEMINGLKKSSALDNDDVELLDLIARNGGNLSRPRNMTGSKASLPDVKIYTTDQILDLEKKQDNVISRHTPPIKESENPEKDKKHERKSSNASENGQDEKYPHITKKDVLGDIKLQNWAELVKLKLRSDPNLRFQDEAEAYNKVNTKAEGNFTAHPGVAPVMAPTFQANTVPYHPSILPHPEGIHAMHANFNIHPDDFHSLPIGVPPYYQYPNVGYPPVMRSLDTELTHQGRPCSNKSQSDHLSQFSEFLYQICDLVDKYWNGSKSLQHHQKFNALADEVIKDFVAKVSRSSAGDVKQLQDHVAQLSDNNTVLKQHSKNMSNDTEVNESLEQAKKKKVPTATLR